MVHNSVCCRLYVSLFLFYFWRRTDYQQKHPIILHEKQIVVAAFSYAFDKRLADQIL